MDKTLKLVLVALCFLILALPFASANADILEEKTTITVDYSDFTGEDQEFVTEIGQLTVRNTDTAPITIQLQFTVPAGYNATTSGDIEIPADTARVIEYSIQVPHEQNSGEKNIGTIRATTTTGTELDQISLVQDTKSMLQIDELDVDYTREDGSSEHDSFDGEDELKLTESVKPGRGISFTFQLKNLFDRDYDQDDSDLEQIVLTITPDDEDLFTDGFNEKEFDLEDITAGERGELTIELQTNEDIDQGDYSIELKVEAEDAHGANHVVEQEILLTIERERDDVRIVKAELSPITACQETASIEIEIKNFGTRDQQKAALTLTSTVLGINENINDITIDRHSNRENSWKRTFSFPVQNKSISAGTYSIDAAVYINNHEQIDYRRIPITVGDCVPIVNEIGNISASQNGTAVPEEIVPEAATATTTIAAEKTPELERQTADIPSGVVFRTIEQPYTKNDLIIAGLVISIAAAIALIVLFGIILLK